MVLKHDPHGEERQVRVSAGPAILDGTLAIPEAATGIVVFAHGSGSSRHSPRNRHVAAGLREARLATLLFDLLTAEEEQADLVARRLRFDVALLAMRLVGAVEWMSDTAEVRDLRVGCFGSSTGAAAALIAAAERPNRIAAVVSRGGRPDLAASALPLVTAPTLLIVGGNDPEVLELNQEAFRELRGERRLEVVPGAGHLFEEPSALDQVIRLARAWFLDHLGAETE